MTVAAPLATGRSLGSLFDGLARVPDELDRTVAALTEDSREVRPGSAFFARRGLRHDGKAFVAGALRAGAVAVIDEGPEGVEAAGEAATVISVRDLPAVAGTVAHRFFGHPSDSLAVAGITGTNGKTTVTHLVAHAFGPAGRVMGTLGFGAPGAAEAATLTTPGTLDVHRLLARARDEGARTVAMEVSSHALDQGRVAGVRFRGAVLTNLSRDHLDYHGDMRAYARAKRALFERPGLGFAVVNVDDPLGSELISHPPPGPQIIGYRLARPVDPGEAVPGLPVLTGEIRALGPEGVRLSVDGPWGTASVDSPLIGRFNAANLLAALATLLALDLPVERAAAALAGAPAVPGRMQRFGGGGRAPLVVVDYAHTPDALENALRALREHCSGALWCVFGCGGERDPGKRPAMGLAVEGLADEVVLTDDNPRGEDGTRIVEDVLGGLRYPERVYVERDRRAAIRAAVRSAGIDDVVLVAGKGHEACQEVAGERIPFSDAETVTEALAEAAG